MNGDHPVCGDKERWVGRNFSTFIFYTHLNLFSVMEMVPIFNRQLTKTETL